MKYNWQKKGWPNFTYELEELTELEKEYAHLLPEAQGILRFIPLEVKYKHFVEVMCAEAMDTSEIEGELLQRESVKSSLRRNFGIQASDKPIPLREKGITELLSDLYLSYDEPVNEELLFNWNKLVLMGRYDLGDIGKWRTHLDPMQIVSGSYNYPVVHFEAPPSKNVPAEMALFFKWYKESKHSLKFMPLVRAGIAHLYFVCIHPFEDGNGRIARALTMKTLFEHAKRPLYFALSKSINDQKKFYYKSLESNNRELDITDWLVYFSKRVIDAVNYSNRLVEFTMHKTIFFDKNRGLLNDRQEKVVHRIFKEGLEGFKGGLSAENYISITKTSRATATRDLQDLVKKEIFLKSGKLKGVRYELNLKVH